MKTGAIITASFVLMGLGYGQSLQFNLDKLAPKAAQVVDVTLDGPLLQLAGKFLSGQEPDEARVKKLIAGLKGIYVKSFEFAKEGEYAEADVEAIRAQLRGPGWSRIVGVRSQRKGENVEVFTKSEGNQIAGFALIAAQPKELTVVSIVGSIDLDQLSELGGHFGVPRLEVQRSKQPKKDGPLDY